MAWQDNLRPASFRGAGFQVRAHKADGGRRAVVTEYPYRDQAQTEDLGRSARRYAIEAFLVGPDYMDDRDALLAALDDKSGPGTLLHPYLGELLVQPIKWALSESANEGGFCTIALEFVEAPPPDESAPGKQAAPLPAISLASIRRVLTVARAGFAIAAIIARNPDFLRNAALSALSGIAGTIAGRFLGWPGLDLRGVIAANTALRAADPANDAATARAITDAHMALALAPALAQPAPAAGTATTSRGAEQDRAAPQARVAALLALPPTSTAMHPDPEALAALTAIDALADDAAVLAACWCATMAEYANADEVDRTRTILLAAIQARRDDAAARMADALYREWATLLADVLADLQARAAALPRLARYQVPGAMPSLALAQRLYGQPFQADTLVALNGARHPAFMAPAGLAPRT